jgi:hypothetical protein
MDRDLVVSFISSGIMDACENSIMVAILSTHKLCVIRLIPRSTAPLLNGGLLKYTSFCVGISSGMEFVMDVVRKLPKYVRSTQVGE